MHPQAVASFSAPAILTRKPKLSTKSYLLFRRGHKHLLYRLFTALSNLRANCATYSPKLNTLPASPSSPSRTFYPTTLPTTLTNPPTPTL
jgi:hypothetical protein